MNTEISATEASRLFAEWVDLRGPVYVSRVFGLRTHSAVRRQYAKTEVGREITAHVLTLTQARWEQARLLGVAFDDPVLDGEVAASEPESGEAGGQVANEVSLEPVRAGDGEVPENSGREIPECNDTTTPENSGSEIPECNDTTIPENSGSEMRVSEETVEMREHRQRPSVRAMSEDEEMGYDVRNTTPRVRERLVQQQADRADAIVESGSAAVAPEPEAQSSGPDASQANTDKVTSPTDPFFDMPFPDDDYGEWEEIPWDTPDPTSQIGVAAAAIAAPAESTVGERAEVAIAEEPPAIEPQEPASERSKNSIPTSDRPDDVSPAAPGDAPDGPVAPGESAATDTDDSAIFEEGLGKGLTVSPPAVRMMTQMIGGRREHSVIVTRSQFAEIVKRLDIIDSVASPEEIAIWRGLLEQIDAIAPPDMTSLWRQARANLDENAALTETVIYAGAGSVQDDERRYWRERLLRLPKTVVPEAAYPDEDDVFGTEIAEALREWRFLKALLVLKYLPDLGPFPIDSRMSTDLLMLLAEQRTSQLEQEFLGQHGFTLPPSSAPLSQSLRAEYVETARATEEKLAEEARKKARAERVHLRLTGWLLKLLGG